MTGQMLFRKAADAAVKLEFYEWAYGRLAEHDVDMGVLGEFVTGLYVGGLDRPRREKGLFDLVADDGTTLEVKTSAGGERLPGGGERLRWGLIAEQKAVKGRVPIADKWVFLAVSFPKRAGRFFDVFDPRWWRVMVVPGMVIRRMDTGRHLSESRLKSEGYSPHPLTDLPKLVCSSRSPVAELARANTAQSLALLRLAFFRWAYGDLTEAFNGGRFAEYQVLRLVGKRPFAPRPWRGPVDVTARNGRMLQVKYSRSAVGTAGTRDSYRYKFGPRGSASPCDLFVLCRLARPDLDPVPLRNWRFHCVPTDAIPAGATTISDGKLARLGFPLLDASALAAAVLGTTAGERTPVIDPCGDSMVAR